MVDVRLKSVGELVAIERRALGLSMRDRLYWLEERFRLGDGGVVLRRWARRN